MRRWWCRSRTTTSSAVDGLIYLFSLYFSSFAADLMKSGAYLKLLDSKIEMVRGTMRLAVNMHGKIEEATGRNFQPKVSSHRFC